MKILKDFPAVTIYALAEGHDIQFTRNKRYTRTTEIDLYIKAFRRTREGYEWLKSFTIGCDGDDPDRVWAFGNSAIISRGPKAKKIAIGAEIGDIVRIEGKKYRIEETGNQNIGFVKV